MNDFIKKERASQQVKYPSALSNNFFNIISLKDSQYQLHIV